MKTLTQITEDFKISRNTQVQEKIKLVALLCVDHPLSNIELAINTLDVASIIYLCPGNNVDNWFYRVIGRNKDYIANKWLNVNDIECTLPHLKWDKRQSWKFLDSENNGKRTEYDITAYSSSCTRKELSDILKKREISNCYVAKDECPLITKYIIKTLKAQRYL